MREELNSMTHFSWGEDQKKARDNNRFQTNFWYEFTRAVRKYVAAANRDYDRNGMGIEVEGEENTLVVRFGIFEAVLLAEGNDIFYAFVSSVLLKLRPNNTDIWRFGQIRLLQEEVIFDPEIRYLEQGVWRKFSSLSLEEVSKWPTADRFAKWLLEKLVVGENAICAREGASS